MSLRIVESALSSPDGNVSRVLKGEMPRIARAEDKDKAKTACELIYKKGSTLKGKQSPQTRLGPLALLSLDTPSLTSPCYTMLEVRETLSRMRRAQRGSMM